MYEATSYYYCLVCRKKITYRLNTHLRDNFCDNFCKYLYHYRIQNRVSPQPMTQYLYFNKNKLEMKSREEASKKDHIISRETNELSIP